MVFLGNLHVMCAYACLRTNVTSHRLYIISLGYNAVEFNHCNGLLIFYPICKLKYLKLNLNSTSELEFYFDFLSRLAAS